MSEESQEFDKQLRNEEREYKEKRFEGWEGNEESIKEEIQSEIKEV